MHWKTTKFNLDLKLVVNLDKYNKQSYILPPIELGFCKNWRFEILNENEAIFWASWDLRKLNRKIILNDIILNDIILKTKEFII